MQQEKRVPLPEEWAEMDREVSAFADVEEPS